MKHILFFLALFSASLTAQENKEESKPAELFDHQKDFLNLPEEQRLKFIEHYSEASRLFHKQRIFESLDMANKAHKIFPNSAEIETLRGSCYVEMRAFDKALDAFNSAIRFAPSNTSIQFNIAEIHFVTHDWKTSHDLFEEVLKATPPENISLTRLIEFKILLCKIKLGKENEAIILSEKYDFLDDSPFHYYAKAAIAFSKKETLKAEQALASAGRIFRNPIVLAPWRDTLEEFGYIPSFYQDQEPEIE